MKIEVVGFFGSDPAKVSPEARQAMTDLFNKSLHEALAKKYQIVDQAGSRGDECPGRDPRCRGGDSRSAVSHDGGPAAAFAHLAVGAVAGKYPFSGGGQAAAKVTDSMTGEVLGAAVDRRTGGGAIQTAAQWQWGDAENAIKAWSRDD